MVLQPLLGPCLPQKMPASSLSFARLLHPILPSICDVSLQIMSSHLVLVSLTGLVLWNFPSSTTIIILYARSCRISLCGHQVFILPQNNPERLMYIGYSISKEFFKCLHSSFTSSVLKHEQIHTLQYTTHSKPWRTVLTICTIWLQLNNSTLCPYGIYMFHMIFRINIDHFSKQH
jgi:hypothetical protein